MNVFFFKLHLKHGVGVEGDTLQENGKASKFTYILTLKHNTVQCWIENTGKTPVKKSTPLNTALWPLLFLEFTNSKVSSITLHFQLSLCCPFSQVSWSMSIIRSQSIKNPRTLVDRAQTHTSFSWYFTHRQSIVKSFHTPQIETSLPFLCVHTGTWLKTARAPRIHYAKIGLYKKSLVRS